MKFQHTNRFFSILFFTSSLLAGVQMAGAQSNYPDRPIKVIVPYVAGGAADITARLVAQAMSDSMGQPVVVENKPGANGTIGSDIVSKAAPDGYTLLLTASGPLVINPVLYKKVPFDPIKDFSPISMLITYQYALVVPAKSPIKNIGELVTEARAKPKAFSYGSTGIGGGGHLAGELFGLLANAEFTHVPYKGAAPALADLLGGQLTFTFEPLVTGIPLMKAGNLRGFAVSGMKRSKAMPSLPTMNELGYKGFNITQFQGLLAPAGTDPAIIRRLNEEAIKALKSPAIIRRLVDEGGNEIVGGTAAEFAQQIQSDLRLYGKLITEAHINAD
jgi:tripartite-type tricarboxylate transporter receptor subunit TctC